jgi:Fe2+ or Zn2+ uptake regulation protein
MIHQGSLPDAHERLWVQLHAAGLNLTGQRRTILAIFFAGAQPVTTIDLWLRAKKADPRTSYGTVWRLLNALVERGLAQRAVSAADGILRYGPVKLECTHQRITCKDCGATLSTVGGPHDPVEQTGKE